MVEGPSGDGLERSDECGLWYVRIPDRFSATFTTVSAALTLELFQFLSSASVIVPPLFPNNVNQTSLHPRVDENPLDPTSSKDREEGLAHLRFSLQTGQAQFHDRQLRQRKATAARWLVAAQELAHEVSDGGAELPQGPAKLSERRLTTSQL